MSDTGAVQPDPSVIGNIAKPPFAKLPDPVQLFFDRTQRFRTLAVGHQLAPYLTFLAGLSEAQYRIQHELAEPEMPGEETLARAREHKMPPIDRGRFTPDAALEAALDRLIALGETLEAPDVARAAFDRVKAADPGTRHTMIQNVLADSIPVESMAEHIFIAAALQVHFARMAARLDAERLSAIGPGVCPACGSPPSASLVVGWPNAEGTRFCACSLCSTLWNYVRVQCMVCGSNKDIAFQEIDGGNANVKAETCGSCRSYVKILYQRNEPALDPVADDVASLGLDILVRELGFNRGGFNPYLLGY